MSLAKTEVSTNGEAAQQERVALSFGRIADGYLEVAINVPLHDRSEPFQTYYADNFGDTYPGSTQRKYVPRSQDDEILTAVFKALNDPKNKAAFMWARVEGYILRVRYSPTIPVYNVQRIIEQAVAAAGYLLHLTDHQPAPDLP